MNWLSRMAIDSETAFSKSMVDNYSLHKKIWECFPGVPDKKRDFLTRIDVTDGFFNIWLLSKQKPVCPQWCRADCFDIKDVAPSFLSHRFYAFDLRANPTRCLVERDSEGKRIGHGKRIPLVKEEDLRAWLIKKGSGRCRESGINIKVSGGFRIVEDKPLEISPMVEYHFRKKEHQAFHGGVQFRGTLEVTDSKHFFETYSQGLGSAKGFGFGLLLLAPINL